MNTPYFLLDESILYENMSSFQNALQKIWPNSQLAYSVKTNSLPWLLKYLKEHHVFAEVVSDEEYMLAKMCGFQPEEIVFNGPIKGPNCLKEALENRCYINIDSCKEAAYVFGEEAVCGEHLGIRINVDPERFQSEDIGYTEDGFRFGFSERDNMLGQMISSYEQKYGHRKIGLHLHCNSVTRSVEVYRSIATFAAEIILKYHLQPDFIDIGGGFFGGVEGKPTPEHYISAIHEILSEAVNTKETKLIVEPGSAIIGSAMELHTTVLDHKETNHARIITTDGSRIYIDPLWAKKGYRYRVNYRSDSKLSNRNQVVCGYTCMDHDRIMVLKEGRELQTGDEIIYERVGAYSATFGGGIFIRYFPEVYVDKGNEKVLIRSKMTTEDYYRLQSNE